MKLKYILSSYILLVLIMIVLFYKIKQLNVPQKRNLILGVIQNYSWEKIEPFFISLIKADFKLCVIMSCLLMVYLIKQRKNFIIMGLKLLKFLTNIRE